MRSQTLVIEAPTDLPEGYTFDAVVDSKTYAILVPDGGLRKGQSITIPYPMPGVVGSPLSVSLTRSLTIVNDGPVGYWRDGLFACCGLGISHGLMWNSLLFPQIVLAQVMSRMNLGWRGIPGSTRETSRTFPIILTIMSLFYILEAILFLICPDLVVNIHAHGLLVFAGLLKYALLVYFLIFSLSIMIKARSLLRESYGIPEMSCIGCEDMCCSIFCTCCTVSQMSRHIINYDESEYRCCTDAIKI
mmetsp:Transcript_30733/g.70326  ORF Transcript_30733/g.70326 Transcript_30733/m.70326 type:complete len:246 (-) Transcript_30733:99-836(-)